VVTAKEGIGPRCKVVVVNTMVAQTDDGGLGGESSPVVTTVVGIKEFPEGVTTFVFIAVCNTVWRS
jgi:hypothetical protein